MPSDFSLTRQMPCSVEAEQALLGAIIIDSQKMTDIADKISKDDFYLSVHASIYEAMDYLFKENSKIDAITVLNEVVTREIFDETTGKNFIMNLAKTVPSVSNVNNYVRIVKEKSLLRKLIQASEEMGEDAYSQKDEVDKLLDRAEQRIYSIAQGKEFSGFSHISDLLRMSYDAIEEKVKNKGKESLAIKTGYSELDKTLIELAPGNLVLLGARPGIGKTSFALNIAPYVASKTGKSVAIFSLEMSKEEVVNRIWTCYAMVDNKHIRNGEVTDEDFDKLAMASAELSKMPIYIDDNANTTVTAMKAKLRRLKNLGFVIIDYLGLMTAERRNDNKATEIGEISRALKILAMEFKIPILLCSQLSRDLEKRKKEEKRPQLSDLRDSGAIEQDADIVLFLYKDNSEMTQENAQNKIEVIIAKNRHGELRTVEMGWIPQYTKFITLTGKEENSNGSAPVPAS